MTPEEKYRLIRAIPHIMLLADGDATVPKSFNVFRTKLVNVGRLQKLFKQYPYVPVIGDMAITLTVILARAPHYEDEKEHYWGYANTTDSSLKFRYSLAQKWKGFREAHIDWVSSFTSAASILKQTEFSKEPDHAEFCKDVKEVVIAGFILVRDMTCAITENSVWKFTHPVDNEKLAAANIDPDTCGEYERVVRHNYSKPELAVLVDTITMIKSISAQLLENEAMLSPVIRLALHSEMQVSC